MADAAEESEAVSAAPIDLEVGRVAAAKGGVALVPLTRDVAAFQGVDDRAAGFVEMGAVGIEALTEIRAELGKVLVYVGERNIVHRERPDTRGVGDEGFAVEPVEPGGRRRVATFAGRVGDVADITENLGIEGVEQTRLADAGRTGNGGDLAGQRLAELIEPLPRFGAEVDYRIDRFIIAEDRFGPLVAGFVGFVEVHLVDADQGGETPHFGENEEAIEHPAVWIWLAHGEEEKGLIGVGENHLLDVAGIAGEAGENSGPWLDRLDLALAFADIDRPDAVADRDEIGRSPLSSERAFDGREEGAGFVAKLHFKEFAVCPNNGAGECRLRCGGWFDPCTGVGRRGVD